MKIKNNGSVLVLGLLVTSILILFGGMFLSLTLNNYTYLYTDSEMVKAHWITRAGLNQMIHDVRDHYFSYDQFLETQKKYLSGVKFGDGTYKGGIGVVTGPGIREILLISEGIVGETSKDSIIVKLRITTPADFLKFIDGSFNFNQNYYDQVLWAGPIHANGSIRMYMKSSAGGSAGNTAYLHIRKDKAIKGPTVSLTGILFHDGLSFDRPQIIIGEGDVSGTFNINTDINKYTSETKYNNIGISSFFINLYPLYVTGSLSKPVPVAFSNGNSPDITFEVTKEDGIRQPLFTDGFHGGYNIAIPKKENIFSEFEKYIDQKWRITYNNLAGGKIVTFYNDAIKQKMPILGSGNSYKYQSTGRELLGEVTSSYPSYYGSYDNIADNNDGNADVDNYNLSNSKNQIPYLDFYPNGRIINLYDSAGNLILNDYYKVRYDAGMLPPGSWWFASSAGRIYFNNPNYIPSAGTKIYASKIRNVYVTNDDKFYTAFGMDSSIDAEYRKGIKVSPLNMIINDINGTITFKDEIEESPLISNRSGVIYTTANLMKQNTVEVSTISKYAYTGDINFPVITTTPDVKTSSSITWLYDYVGKMVQDSLGCCIDMYGNVFDASSGDVILRPKKYNGPTDTPSRNQINGAWYDENYYATKDYKNDGHYSRFINPTVYIDYPLISPKSGTNEPDIHIYYLKNTTTIPLSVPDVNLYEIFQDGHTEQTSNPGIVVDSVGTYSWVYDSKTTQMFGQNNQFKNIAGFYNFRFTSASLPQSPILVSYKYKYRPIIKVKSDLYTPTQSSYIPTITTKGISFNGFKTVCIDPLIKAVEIDLSDIISDNYPRNGVIFSEVPLIVKGIPKKPITIVCLDDIYLGSINSTYYRDDGTIVNSNLEDDDTKAYPVGIISSGAVWNYYHLNRNRTIPLEYTVNTSSCDPSFYVKLNKVAVITQGDKLYAYGGLKWTNTGGIIGSFISGTSHMGPQVVDEKYLSSNYYVIPPGDTNYLTMAANYQGVDLYSEGEINPWGKNPEKYASSFRRNLPPHFPTDIRIKNWYPFTVTNTEKFIEELSQYLNDTTYTGDPEKLEDVYKELTIKYFGGI